MLCDMKRGKSISFCGFDLWMYCVLGFSTHQTWAYVVVIVTSTLYVYRLIHCQFVSAFECVKQISFLFIFFSSHCYLNWITQSPCWRSLTGISSLITNFIVNKLIKSLSINQLHPRGKEHFVLCVQCNYITITVSG